MPVRSTWSEPEYSCAVQALKSGNYRNLAEACVAIGAAFGRNVAPRTLSDAFTVAGLSSPGTFLIRSQRAPSIGGFTAQDRQTVPPVTPQVGASAGPSVISGPAPVIGSGVTLPVGHRLRGVSVLSDAKGELRERWDKTEQASLVPPAFDVVPPGHTIRKVSSLLDGQGQVRAQWIQAPREEVEKWEQFWKACEASVAPYRGLAEPANQAPLSTDDLLTVYVVGDAHIGLHAWAPETGDNFDLKIAEQELVRATELLIDRTPASTRATFLNVGDWFHTQGDDQRTPTSGVKLDADSRFGKIAEIGFRTMRRCTDRLLHDPHMARMLAMWMRAVYEREPRVIVEDNNRPYLYQVHGKNLLGYFHGDGAKLEQMPSIMAADKPVEWGASIYRNWLGGHVHHKIRKEFPGCSVETFQTLAPKDYWHTHKGYRSGQSMSAITFDREFGETTRSTVDIRLVRAA
jgi:hypothetical protein